VNVDASLEQPQPGTDAVTVAFGDPVAGTYGLARTGRADGDASSFAVLFRDGETVAVRADGVTTRVLEPLARWEVAFDAGPEGGFALELDALGAPAVIDPDSPAGAAGAMQGYEHVVRARGTARAGGHEVAVDCLGQRSHQWGAPDWKRMALARTLGAWLGDDLAVVLSSVRPTKAREHDEEAVTASVLEGAPLAPVAITQPLLSTTYDADGHQRRAGFELWPPGDDAYPRRGAGEVVCGTSVDLGELRLDCAFFRWRMEGREGVGRYDVLRRT